MVTAEGNSKEPVEATPAATPSTEDSEPAATPVKASAPKSPPVPKAPLTPKATAVPPPPAPESKGEDKEDSTTGKMDK